MMPSSNKEYFSITEKFKKIIYTMPTAISLLGMIMLTVAFFQVRIADYMASLNEYARFVEPQAREVLEDDANSDSLNTQEQLMALLKNNFAHINYIGYVSILEQNKHDVVTWINDFCRQEVNQHCYSDIENNVVVEDNDYAMGTILFHSRHDFTTNDGKRYSIRMGLFTTATLGVVFKYFVPMYLIVIIGYCVAMFFMSRKMRRLLVEPVLKLTATTSKIIENGDLNIPIPFCGHNELGDLANSFEQLLDKLKNLLRAIKSISDQFNCISQKMHQTGLKINSNSNDIREQSEQTTYLMNELNVSFAAVSKQLEELSTQSEHSASTVHEISMVNNEVADNINTMRDSVTNTITGINQITYSINFTTKSIEDLHTNVNDVNAAITRLNGTVNIEEKSARESLDIANQLAADSANGMQAMEQTIGGIDKIQASSSDVFQRIQKLRQHVEDIDSIVHVIDNITKQTNLLALNAAIIAAQAGENGKSFGVVSEEITALANRTKQSTKEITGLIAAIQEETIEAAKAMEFGQHIIDEGAAVGDMAMYAFKALQKSADQSAAKAKNMAEATFEQAKDIKLVTEAINNIISAINSVNEASHAQADEARVLDSSTKKMDLLNKKVAESSEEQGRSSKNVLDAIQVINEMTQQAISHQHRQTDQTQQAVNAVAIIGRSTALQQQSANELFAIIEDIKRHQEQLALYISEFKV